MGFIREQFGRIAIESRSGSFYIHPSYGYDESGNVHSDELGDFGIYWRSRPHPEFLVADLDDLIAALSDYRASLDDARPDQACPYCLRDVSTYQGPTGVELLMAHRVEMPHTPETPWCEGGGRSPR